MHMHRSRPTLFCLLMVIIALLLGLRGLDQYLCEDPKISYTMNLSCEGSAVFFLPGTVIDLYADNADKQSGVVLLVKHVSIVELELHPQLVNGPQTVTVRIKASQAEQIRQAVAQGRAFYLCLFPQCRQRESCQVTSC